MFISIIDFDIKEKDDYSFISIITIDANGKPEKIQRIDRTNVELRKWIQVGQINLPNLMVSEVYILKPI